MNFEQYIGQDRIKNILKESVENNTVSHAYSFDGPEGMGKLTLAKVFAEAIVLQEDEQRTKTGMSCTKVSIDTHPDVEIISPKKLSIGVDEIRELQQKIIIKPIRADRKIYIIDEADRMTVQAQNCLLKTLEEPPKYAVLILCVSNSSKMLRTIQSRCIKIKFKNYSNEEIKTILKMHEIGREKSIDFAVGFSQGIPGKAFAILTKEFLGIREGVFEALEKFHKFEVEEIYETAGFLEENKDSIEDIFDIMITWYRDLIIYRNFKDENLLINYDKKDIILNNILSTKDVNLVKIIELIENSRKNLKMNIGFQLVVDNMVLSLWEVYNGKNCRSAV